MLDGKFYVLDSEEDSSDEELYGAKGKQNGQQHKERAYKRKKRKEEDSDEELKELNDEDQRALSKYAEGSNYTEDGQNAQFSNKKSTLNSSEHELGVSDKVSTSLKYSLSKIDHMQNAITKDKNDRATVDQVLDPRTLIVLHKLI